MTEAKAWVGTRVWSKQFCYETTVLAYRMPCFLWSASRTERHGLVQVVVDPRTGRRGWLRTTQVERVAS